jgi:hypothetical protein
MLVEKRVSPLRSSEKPDCSGRNDSFLGWMSNGNATAKNNCNGNWGTCKKRVPCGVISEKGKTSM